VECYQSDWQPLVNPRLLATLDALLRLKEQGEVEEAASMLHSLADLLQGYKRALKFKKMSIGAQELARQLFLLQSALKRDLEATCQQKCVKIPLQLQNFTPLSFSNNHN
jgi:hypothetical protein